MRGAASPAGRAPSGRPPLVVNFLGLVAVRLPLAMVLARPAGSSALLPGFGLGAVGAWYAMAADLTVRGLAMLAIFTCLRWARGGIDGESTVARRAADATLSSRERPDDVEPAPAGAP